LSLDVHELAALVGHPATRRLVALFPVSGGVCVCVFVCVCVRVHLPKRIHAHNYTHAST
jgi:hypothetical protein